MRQQRERSATELGGALLAVLWLTAALGAIAFSVASTVRGETERATTKVESLRAYYLATGAIERALTYILWGPAPPQPDGTIHGWQPGMAQFDFEFPTGKARVQLIPETSKMNVNLIPAEELFRLLANLGMPAERANQLTAAIVDRRGLPAGGASLFDQYYLSQDPSFRPVHASFMEIEELLLVKGMTPELFHGTYSPDEQGRLQRRDGLKDCVTVFGAPNNVDVNTAPPAVLATIGLTPQAVGAIVERRRAASFRSMQELQPLQPFAGPGFSRLMVGGPGTIFSFRATAELRLPDGRYSDLKRSVTAVIKFHEPGYSPALEVLRWYDN